MTPGIQLFLVIVGWLNALAAIVALLCANDALRKDMPSASLIIGFCSSSTIAVASFLTPFLP